MSFQIAACTFLCGVFPSDGTSPDVIARSAISFAWSGRFDRRNTSSAASAQDRADSCFSSRIQACYSMQTASATSPTDCQ